MKKNFLFLLLTLFLVTSCSKDDEPLLIEPELSDYQISVINYFKEIALGFEFGNSSRITRKWNSDMEIFIGGEPGSELLLELENIGKQINELATDGFNVTFVNDSLQSNYYIFFGSASRYAEMFPATSHLVNSNWGLFSVRWDGQNQIYRGHMYVDMMRANLIEQKHLLREELTQSLGLAQDSPRYMQSIFQSRWTTTTQYARIDKDLIRLLYHPNMQIGLDETQVDTVLREILISE